MALDPATMALLIKVGGELASALIRTLRATGKDQEAEEIRAILSRSDRNWQDVLEWAEGS